MSTNPNKIITLQELINAQVDAYKLELIMNEAPWVEIQTRWGRKCYSIATISDIIEKFQLNTQTALTDLQDAIAQIVEGGVPDLAVSTFSGRTQEQENKDFVSSVYDYSDLDDIAVADGRAVEIKQEGKAGVFVYKPNPTKAPDGGTVIEDSQGRIWERIDLSNPKLSWWEAVGDNVADDTVALQAANTFFRTHKIYVDGDGKTYKSTTRGTWMRYLKNATVRVDVDSLSVVYNADGDYAQLTDGIPRGFGRGEFYSAKLGMCMNRDEGYSSGVYIGGFETLKNVTSMTSNILIGDGIMSVCDTATAPRFNIAIGDSAMTYAVNTGGGTNGTRNIAIGPLALHFMTNGSYNTAIGRNSQHNSTTGTHNTTLGYGSGMMGYAPVGWSGKIEMQMGTGAGSHNTTVGALAYQYGAGSFNVVIGKEAANKLTRANSNTIIGSGSGYNLDNNISYKGTLCSYATTSGTYTINGDVVTVVLSSVPTIGLSVGDDIGLYCSTGDLTVESGQLTITTVVNANTFTFTLPNTKKGLTIGGNCALRFHIKATVPSNTASSSNVIIGRNSAFNKTTAHDSVIIGNDGANVEGEINLSVGIGTRALNQATATTNSVAIGYESLRLKIDGTNLTSITNIVGIGYQVRASADNQIQLGNSLQTTYAYGAIQDRSDIRDKTDIEAMPNVMTDFILGLNAAQGVWDMRDDYVSELPNDWTEQQIKEWWSNPIKDGSKKRERKHNWFIAQEVKALADKLGIDFAGLQDHKVIDGTDTLTLGYEEFIPPVVAVLQKAWSRLDDIEKRLAALEK